MVDNPTDGRKDGGIKSHVPHGAVKLNDPPKMVHCSTKSYDVYFDMFQEMLSTRIGTKYHRSFIYGFDRNKRILYVTDHFDHGKYALAQLGFDEFLKAYEFTYWDSDGCKLSGFDKKTVREAIITIAKPKPLMLRTDCAVQRLLRRLKNIKGTLESVVMIWQWIIWIG